MRDVKKYSNAGRSLLKDAETLSASEILTAAALTGLQWPENQLGLLADFAAVIFGMGVTVGYSKANKPPKGKEKGNSYGDYKSRSGNNQKARSQKLV